RLMFLTFFGEARGDRHTHEHAHESPMVMVAPLGVLALGAVFAGMIWYGSFFGSHEQVNRFFGIEAHAEASADHGEAAATEEAAKDHAAPATAPAGAIFMAEDNHVLDDAHHAPAWVKV
ncbi:MAG TPA: NADH-quinone oxidoreductase subunit L, partial [Roseovarius sp.]|nr:NADH-quinone oxidoreductase subunit L [Roseovarius sp.]